MEKYKITFKKSAARDLCTVPDRDVKQVLKRIAALAENPRCEDSKKLSGRELYRIRQGNYRIVYEILDRRVVVYVVRASRRLLRVARRSVVYN